MKKSAIKLLAFAGLLPFAAKADLLGATAGADFWYADAKINDIRADDAKVQQSYHLAFEHPIPIVPNAKLRYTGVSSDKFNTDFDQYDVIAYYEILSNDLLALDVGVSIQYFSGKFNGQSFDEWQPNVYADGVIGIPATPLSVFASFNVGEWDNTKTADAEAGIAFSLVDIFPLTVDIKAGYRIMDYDFDYFKKNANPDLRKARMLNNGFFLGVEIDI